MKLYQFKLIFFVVCLYTVAGYKVVQLKFQWWVVEQNSTMSESWFVSQHEVRYIFVPIDLKVVWNGTVLECLHRDAVFKPIQLCWSVPYLLHAVFKWFLISYRCRIDGSRQSQIVVTHINFVPRACNTDFIN